MAESPARRQFTYRYTNTLHQNRQENTTNKFESISQKSPNINSPILNEESELIDSVKYQINTELKTKLQIVLKHNSQLLNENATLSEMVNSLRMELDIQRREAGNKTMEVNLQMNKFMQEIKNQQIIHEGDLARLLNQINGLHEQNLRFQTQKHKQIKNLKQHHERQLAVHIVQIKRSTDDNKDILNIQINQLKETIEMRDFELEALRTETKCEIDRLKFQNKGLLSQIQYMKKLKDIQIKEILNQNRDKNRMLTKQMEREKQLQILKRQTNIKKLKKQINQKNLEIQQARKEGSLQTEELYDELNSARNQKMQLLEQLQDAKDNAVEKLNRQKQRLRVMSELEKQNMDNIINVQRNLLKQQRQKVILLCIQKTHEIKRLYDHINEQKETFESEKQTLQDLLTGFKNRLKSIELDNKQGIQLLKVKMAQLHEGDIRALQSYYQNEIRNLVKENKIISEHHQADRAKIHKAFQENDELRKNFQIQISKQKAKLQDMKVKFAAANVQFKEQITSFGTKMQLTSQTLLRETEQKQKGAEFFQTQKRKLYRIIQEKDKQIIAIQETMSKIKEINDEEITQLHTQINMLRDSLITKQQDLKDFKANLQSQFQRKSLKIIQETQKNSPDDEMFQQNKTLRQKCSDLQKQNFKKTKQIQFLLRQTKSLQGELGLRAGFIQTIQLQSSAAIEDEKSKIKILMNQSEVAMRDYYENKIISKEKDIQNLKKQLGEKDYDLRALISKYNGLERKMKQLLEAQNKLTEFETKIVNLGLDQNLVKNMAELFKKNKNGSHS